MKFLFRYRIPASVLFFGCQFVWFSTQSSLMHLESISLLAWLSLIFLFGFWLFLLLDMMNQKIYNKTFWMISMLVLPAFAPVFYLFQRKKLKHLRSSIFSRKDRDSEIANF